MLLLPIADTLQVRTSSSVPVNRRATTKINPNDEHVEVAEVGRWGQGRKNEEWCAVIIYIEVTKLCTDYWTLPMALFTANSAQGLVEGSETKKMRHTYQ